MAQRAANRQDCREPSQPAASPSFLTDIHCHILPDFDDGAKTMGESLAMAEIAAAGGVSAVIATPHIGADLDVHASHRIRDSIDALQAAIDNRGIHLRILPGAEVFPSSAVPEWLDAGYPITLAGSGYILLDCPFMTMPVGLDQLVFRLQSRGIVPILAHPERSLPIQRNPQLLERLVQGGMLMQLDAMSVLGRNGSAAASAARLLLGHRWVHFMASDAHSANRSRPRLAEAARELVGVIGEDAVAELVRGNPNRLLSVEPIQTDPADYAARRGFGFLAGFLRRGRAR